MCLTYTAEEWRVSLHLPPFYLPGLLPLLNSRAELAVYLNTPTDDQYLTVRRAGPGSPEWVLREIWPCPVPHDELVDQVKARH